jgi:hypothetical protein
VAVELQVNRHVYLHAVTVDKEGLQWTSIETLVNRKSNSLLICSSKLNKMRRLECFVCTGSEKCCSWPLAMNLGECLSSCLRSRSAEFHDT